MTDGLTARQTQLLKTIVTEYIDTATPVGSVAIEKKYELGVSPATIRNEMVALTKSGYLKQPHTSAGRIPTPKAMKFYINQLMDERQLSVAEEVKAKEDVWQAREDMHRLMDRATRALAERTDSFAVGTIGDQGVWSHGHANIFNHPELIDYQICQNLFAILDENRRVQELFFERLTGMSPIEVLFGEEIGWEMFEPIGIVATRFQVGDKEGAIAVVGPYRLNYSTIIPTVRYFGNLIEQVAS